MNEGSFLATYNQWFTNGPPQRHRAHGGHTEKKTTIKGWAHLHAHFKWNYKFGDYNQWFTDDHHRRHEHTKEIEGKFQVLKFYYFFSLCAFSVNSVSLW